MEKENQGDVCMRMIYTFPVPHNKIHNYRFVNKLDLLMLTPTENVTITA